MILKFFLILFIFINILYANNEKKTNSIINIKKIDIQGNTSIDEHTALNILTNDIIIGLLPYNIPFVDFKVNEEKILQCKELMENYLYDNGFQYSTVSCGFNKKNGILTYHIIDGKKIKIKKIVFKSDFEKLKICKTSNICIKVGSFYSKNKIKILKSKISEYLEDNGYIFAKIKMEPIYIDDYNIELHITVNKGIRIFIGKITYDINGNIDPAIIENMIFFQNGDIFQYKKIRDSIQILKSKKVFSSIIITPVLNEIENGIVPIIIKLTVKKKTKKVKINLGFDSFEGVKAGVEWTNFMYKGDLRKLNFKLEASKYIQNIETSFNYPFLFPVYKINFYNDFGYKKEDTIVSQNQYLYDTINLNRDFKNINVKLGFHTIYNSPLHSDLSDNYDFIFSIYEEINFIEVDDIFFPRNGYKIESSLESSIFFSGFDFLELKMGLYGYYPLIKKYNLFLSGKLLIDNIKSDTDIIQIKKPLSGGYNSNRGYEFASLSYSEETNSISKIESSIEIKKEVYNNLYIFTFDDYSSFNDEDYNSVGLGVYYYTPLGVISVGGAYNSDNDYNGFFSFGASF